MEEVPILNVRLHQKYLPKRVVSGRRCQLLVIKLSRCFEIICNWQTNSSKTNKYMSSRRCNWLFKVTDNRYIIFHFGGRVKRLQKPHSLQSVSPSLVLTIHTLHSYLLRVWMSLYCFTLSQHENCFFSSVTNLLHAEFGTFYNFIWKNSQYQTIW